MRSTAIKTALAAASLLCLVVPARAEDARVVAVGGSVTEIVYALEEAERLAAVDSTSQYPPAARELPSVGYLRQLSAEPILSMGPELLLAEPDAGPPPALEQIRDAGVRVVTVPDTPSPTGVLEKIAVVAEALGVPDKGAALKRRVRTGFDEVKAALSGIEQRPRVLFLLSIGEGAPLAAGKTTAADAIIEMARGKNVVEGFTDYKPLTPEAAARLAPEVLLLNENSLKALGGREAVLARPEIAATPAGREERLIVMDGLLLLGFGPRTPKAVRRLAEALHPALELARAEGE